MTIKIICGKFLVNYEDDIFIHIHIHDYLFIINILYDQNNSNCLYP